MSGGSEVIDFHNEDWTRKAIIDHDAMDVLFHCTKTNRVTAMWEDYRVFITMTDEAWHVTQYYGIVCEGSMWVRGYPAHVTARMVEDIVANLFNSTTFSGEVMRFEYDC